jgi:hypothetical protein
MIPIVVHGAKTQVKLGSVSPEVQYLLTSFTTDMTTLGKAAGGGGGQENVGQQKNSSNSDYYVNQLYKGRIILIKATMETLRGIYRMKDINPLAIFKVRVKINKKCNVCTRGVWPILLGRVCVVIYYCFISYFIYFIETKPLSACFLNIFTKSHW